ncbi:hypothetical protein AMTRI_Chr09g39670 [Amborella trichopoda]
MYLIIFILNVILGTIACNVGLAVLEPSMIGESVDPFYCFPIIQTLRKIPNKLLGVLSMVSVPMGLLAIPFLENDNSIS